VRLDRTHAQFAEAGDEARDLADEKYVAADEERLRARGYETHGPTSPNQYPVNTDSRNAASCRTYYTESQPKNGSIVKTGS
jgi:hypothetical protein